jgi:hypothetical protein
MAILWSLIVQFTVDHFSMPVMQLAGAVNPFILSVAMLIDALIGLSFLAWLGVTGTAALGIGWYWFVPGCGPFSWSVLGSLWLGGGVAAGVCVLMRGMGERGIAGVGFTHAVLSTHSSSVF